MKLPVYECLVNDNIDDLTGIYAMSFVDLPANETDFVALNKQQEVFLNKNSQKQILTGVILKPDQLIYRNSPEIGEHYIKFSTQQIERIAQKMMRTGIALHNTTHQHQASLQDNYLFELWIVEDPQSDKSLTLGFENLPKGTLMCSYKIEDKNYWVNEVMTGNVKGFSLEGFFNQQVSMSNNKSNQKQENMNKQKKSALLRKITRFFLDIEDVKKDDATASGEAFVVFVLEDGKEVYVDQDGFATLDEEQMAAGEHNLADGNILVIDAEGQFVETKEAAAAANNPDEKTAPQTLNRRQSLSETDPALVEALKAKIADLEAKLLEISGLAKEASAEMQKLKKVTPTSMPVTALQANQRKEATTRHEQMAQALSRSMRKKVR